MEQMKAILLTLGWTQQPPEGGGAVRERWESLAALLSVAEDLEAEANANSERVPQPEDGQQPLTLQVSLGRAGPSRRGATRPSCARCHGFHTAFGKGPGMGRGGVARHS